MNLSCISRIARYILSISLVVFGSFPFKVLSQTNPEELKKLSIEELMNMEVISVSKVPEKLSEAASAIQVITQHDIQRSAATNLAEALRLAANLQVSQISSRHWIIGARGFNSVFSNKLLVMIDGRTVYSPLFAGVFWDAQSVMLEDIDRIEVISGPGATLWGANAVNGVINVITKAAKDTQGLYVSQSAGSFLKGAIEARYGGKIAEKLSYRGFAQHQDRNNTFLSTGSKNSDDWRTSQSGFSLDWDPSPKNKLSVQGNFYGGKELLLNTPSSIDGQNIMGTWQHSFSDSSNIILQAYADRTWRRDVPGTINDELITYDFDIQHRLPVGKRNNFLWGLGYRFMDDRTDNSTLFVGFLPANRKMHLFNGFVQNEIVLIPECLQFILGSKFHHNDFSGFGLQPSGRISFRPSKNHLVWAAVSRALRAPSRIDVDYHLPTYEVPPNMPSVDGGPNFTSEKLTAYELGYRMAPLLGMSLSVSGFYNRYNDLYSVESVPGTATYQIQNGARGKTYGLEFATNFVATSWWRIRGGYTYFFKKLENKPGNLTDASALENLGSDAKNHYLVQSMFDLPGDFKTDMILRYVDYRPASPFNARISEYTTMDAQITWQPSSLVEVSFSGQNLFQKRHLEALGAVKVPRGIYGKISLRY